LGRYNKGQKSTGKNIQNIGIRQSTVLIFLQTPLEGGEIVFPYSSITISPKQGDALFWYHLNPDTTEDLKSTSVHSSVVSGTEWILTKTILKYPK